jgi:hypothetical protein
MCTHTHTDTHMYKRETNNQKYRETFTLLCADSQHGD